MGGKQCFKCGETKPLYQFYKHPMMGDGHLGKCKECAKIDVRANRRKKINYYRAYDVARFKTPERRNNARQYFKRYKQRYPERAVAHNAVSNAIRDGRMVRQPCEVCGDAKSEAHHDDYSKPLDVRWLCFKHHREHHYKQAA